MRRKAELDELLSQAKDWEERYEVSMENGRIEAIFNRCTPRQLLDMWATARNLAGNRLSDDEFASLCENLVDKFGDLPEEMCGSRGAPLTPKEQAAVAKEDELASIPDTDMLTRKRTAELLGITTSTLDRYERRCEPIGGVLLEPVKLGSRVKYRATNVKAIRAGLVDQARQAKAAKLAEAERYAVPGAKPRQ